MAKQTAIYNGTVVLQDRLLEDGVVLIEDGMIVAVGQKDEVEIPVDAEIVDAKGNYIAPGFVDIHNHGGGGVWAYLDPYTFATAHLKHGTTSVLPTLSYNESEEETIQGLRKIKSVIESDMPYRKAIAGIHMEGPYINKKYGAVLSPIRPVNKEEYTKILDEAGSYIRLWTLAPELDGQVEFAKEAKKYNISLSVGHSEATPEQIFELVPYGLNIGCHCMNASGVTPNITRYEGTREVGVDEAVLLHDDIYAEVIPDATGVHVRPLMLQLIMKTKGIDRVIIITDGMPDSGMKELGFEEFDVNFNEKGALSGSCLTMDRAVRNMMRHTNADIVSAFRMAAYNPAKAVGIDDEVGSIEVGKLGNIIVVNKDMVLNQVILAGEKFL